MVQFAYRPVPKVQHKRNKPTAKQRGTITPATRKALHERSQGLCEACGRGGIQLQAAHLVRRWKLERTTVNHLAHLCLSCHQWADNTKEGRIWLERFGELLKLRD